MVLFIYRLLHFIYIPAFDLYIFVPHFENVPYDNDTIFNHYPAE